MKTPRQIYAEFNIMPSLQLHQLRVAAVGKLICGNISVPVNPVRSSRGALNPVFANWFWHSSPRQAAGHSASNGVNTETVVLAGLFHDMGNIIKSDLAYFPDFIEPEGIEHWQKIKDEYIRKYGHDSHKAIEMIAREIGLPENVLEVIDRIGFSHAAEVRSYGSWELKVCIYSDWRVGPRGVLTMKERLDEARRRYAERNMGDIIKSSEEEFIKLLNACVAIEKQLESAGFNPEEATDERIAPIISGLWDCVIQTKKEM